jgi:hypothetical protein
MVKPPNFFGPLQICRGCGYDWLEHDQPREANTEELGQASSAGQPTVQPNEGQDAGEKVSLDLEHFLDR